MERKPDRFNKRGGIVGGYESNEKVKSSRAKRSTSKKNNDRNKYKNV